MRLVQNFVKFTDVTPQEVLDAGGRRYKNKKTSEKNSEVLLYILFIHRSSNWRCNPGCFFTRAADKRAFLYRLGINLTLDMGSEESCIAFLKFRRLCQSLPLTKLSAICAATLTIELIVREGVAHGIIETNFFADFDVSHGNEVRSDPKDLHSDYRND